MTADDDFRELVEAWQHKVFRLVVSVLGPYREADAEDVMQEVFLQVFRHAKSFRGDARFGTWLYTIARNRAIDKRRTARFRLPHVGEDVLARMASPGSAGDAFAQRRVIAECLEEMPELYRTLLYLRYWQDASVEEIAEYTGLVPGTAKSYLARARERVGIALQRKGVQAHE